MWECARYSFDCNSCFICSFIAKNESFGRPPLSPPSTHLSLSRLSPFTVLVSLSGSGCCCSYYSTSLSLSHLSIFLPLPFLLRLWCAAYLIKESPTPTQFQFFPKKKLPPPLPPNLSCCRQLAVTRLTKLRSSARDSAGSRGREGEGKWLSGVMLYGMFDQSFWYSGIFCSISIWHLIRAQTICTTMELPCTEMKNNLRTLSLERREDGVLKQ